MRRSQGGNGASVHLANGPVKVYKTLGGYHMKKFMLGLALGLVVGAAGIAAAQEADSTWLDLWQVRVRGHLVCVSPTLWRSLRLIECG